MANETLVAVAVAVVVVVVVAETEKAQVDAAAWEEKAGRQAIIIQHAWKDDVNAPPSATGGVADKSREISCTVSFCFLL